MVPTPDDRREPQDSEQSAESVQIESEPTSSEFTDLEESGGEVLATASSLEHTSDALYIVREGNYLRELDDEFEAAGIELREEVE
jgi:hypothetical protein